MTRLNRRDFLKMSAVLTGSAWLTTVSGCLGSNDSLPDNATTIRFDHGVASGDPLQDRVVLWTRATPAQPVSTVALLLEIATDRDFTQDLQRIRVDASQQADYCCKVDVTGLLPGKSYYYRFADRQSRSAIGHTKTLPSGSPEKIQLGVVSCSNYPAGYFHVYQELAKRTELDAVLHLGDYIYEYATDGYAGEDAVKLGRTLADDNNTEIISLTDYRRRYARYRTDPALQKAHQQHAFLLVWDDHEVCNDAWQSGAENHQSSEGSYQDRKLAALQAYFEWMPIRPKVDAGKALYRHFRFGDLASIYMLDTRLEARSQPLDYANYFSAGGFDSNRFAQDLMTPGRALLGASQMQWLQAEMLSADTKWQLLGQQVLMARMTLPAELIAGLANPGPALLTQMADLAKLKAREQQNDPSLTPAELARLKQPQLPYNLDAWDGYPAEREQLYATVQAMKKQLIVLAGDTHNAWMSELTDMHGKKVGVEYATASVSSPGLESYLKLSDTQSKQFAQLLPMLISELKQCDVHRRGFMQLAISKTQVECHWHFVSSIKQKDYQLEAGFNHSYPS
ncbi:MAG TPA: alkaline phosphatase [Rheinheimera sp.]|uniref:alkaline phosphatase D family protein n=1 Tax=Rheinheimera sp. TaxID=1869214 RepID=UPI000ED9ECFA|nr:alkaline phosphatase D family protein [Rheinheimera sp.]HCU67501.1 alkaline phosphatase [Rheinheimera sp.]